MKARFFEKVSLGLVLSALPLVGACNQQTTDAPQSLITAAQAEPSLAPDTGDATLASGPAAPETTPPPLESAPAPNSGKTLPPNIKPASPVGEVVKLAQAGVDEAVMLGYVNNSASMFNLASDEIIYLNDIGAPNSVVTAMIQRDQALKQSWTDAAQAQNATAQANAPAAAPTYVNPPQPEAPPAAADVAPPQQPANVTDNYFYDSLSPYGSWVDIEGYGRCWQPTVVVVNRGWRPYCDRGRWLYTDAGWYWNSDYSWGATTFHYGRWFNDTRWGWCWYPDNVWASSWVTWRSSSDYCGWAPLPPTACYRPSLGFTYYNNSVGLSFGFGLGADCFTFVSWNNFCNRQPSRHCAPAQHASHIYNNTTVINNYVSGHNNTIINHGVPIDQVRRHTGTEIRQVAIRETRNADHGARGERLERDGRTLVVHRPNLPPSAGDTTMSPRNVSNLQPGHPPAAGAGAAAQVELLRSHGSDRVARTQSGTPPTVSPPRLAAARTAAQSPPVVSGNTRATPPAARPTPGGSGGTQRGRDDRPATTPSLTVRGGHSASTTTLTLAPQSRATINPPPAQNAPPGSLVVIGRRDSNPGQNRNTDNEQRAAPARSPRMWSANQAAPTSQPSVGAPQVQTPRALAPTPPVALAYNRPTTQPTRQVAPSSRTYSSPAPAAPSPRPQSVAPTLNAPRSTPTYSAPRSSPAPSYSAPTYSAPAYTPAPSRAPAAAPAQDRSQSGRNGSSRRN